MPESKLSKFRFFVSSVTELMVAVYRQVSDINKDGTLQHMLL